MSEEQKQKEFQGQPQDNIELFLKEIMENTGQLEAAIKVIVNLKETGILDSVEHLSHLMSSKEFLHGAQKAMNLLSALIHSMSSEMSSNAINSILYNSEAIWEGMVVGAKNPEATSFLRLYAMLKDPETSAGLTAVLNALKAIGMALKKVPEE